MSRLYLDKMVVDEEGLLGPAPRLLLWLHGCERNCPGCIAADWNRAPAQYSLSVGTLLQLIRSNPALEGVTISGGEPFLQAEALGELVAGINKGIIVYSGYTKAELEQLGSDAVEQILKKIDVLIDGAYVEELDDNQAFRGSSNQNIHLLTDRYQTFYAASSARKTKIEQKDGFLYLYGIPDEQAKKEWLLRKKAAK